MINEDYLSKNNGVYEVRGAAGSGKTTQLVKDIKELQSNNKRIAVISYSNAAVDELNSRLGNNELTLSTIHSFCWKILKPVSTRILDKITNTDKFSPEGLKNKDSYTIDDVISINYGESGYSNFDENTGELWLSHDEVIELFILSINEIPEFVQIIANSFDNILIDEYQDTNGIFLRKLFERLSGLLVIGIYGDPYQSVFLNGDTLNIASVKDKFGIDEIYLKNNYRSQRSLVDFFNDSRANFDNLKQDAVTELGSKPRVFVGKRTLSEQYIERINSNMEFSNSIVLSLTNGLRMESVGFKEIAEKLKTSIPHNNVKWSEVLKIDQLDGHIKLIWRYSDILYGSEYDSVQALLAIFSLESIEQSSLLSIHEFLKNQKKNYSGIDEFIDFGLELNSEYKNSQEYIKKFTKRDLKDISKFYKSLQDINDHSATIYSAKGLEFDNVILNIDYGYYPNRNWNQINFNHSEDDSLDINSDIMSYLFYVGITRAKKGLAIYINKNLHADFLSKFEEKFKNLEIDEI